MGCDVISDRRQQHRLASYELTLRVANDDAIVLVDLQQSLADDLVEMTLIKVAGGHVEVTFVAGKTTFWDDAGYRDRVSLRSNEVNIVDGDWHRIEVIRYNIVELLSDLE